ncbi:polysaccharide biosynthesis protein [Halobacteriovorax sp. BALOs_7]|uniref:NeuD/PglB/VioB family sugar acetyltransferase n=1 Tax=Halobacteriovorax sp. BALOs_7 TaxID=2109558 RepID=UPI000EB6A1AA|nr:NeuD/PglB/VioB family sugar acetyltransferase [Halobacteriovorax sp. BALOs_7]AYF43821.1 polysaccharide biosynthesis protein [Halobacteriovorax sp. BALOs_7]
MKRAFDIAFSIFAIAITSPILVLVSFLSLLIQGRPIFFIQERVGYKNKIFKMVKFRTMSLDTSLDESQRIGFYGKMLRKFSIDELPEFFNILFGDLSVVGPRPLLKEYIPFYTKEQARRHDVKPGLTGLAQVSGRNSLSWNEKFKFDISYIEKQSFFFDIKIILMTIKQMIKPVGINSSKTKSMERFDHPFYLFGGGGHSLSVQFAAEESGQDIYAIYDKNLDNIQALHSYKDAILTDSLPVNIAGVRGVLAIGSNSIRKKLSQDLSAKWETIIHPSATIHESAVIGHGTVVLSGAYIGPNAVVGNHVIINTGSIVEHDCVVEDFSHICPNTTLCGGVHIGELTMVGAGSVVKPLVKICSEVVIGLNSSVIKNIDKPGTYIGQPVRRLPVNKEVEKADIRLSMAKPVIEKDDIDGVVSVLESGILSLGPKVEEFEKNIQDYIGVKEAVAVSSGTSALYLALLALGVGEGDEVIVPSYTFVSSVSVILHAGATPVFADIEDVTHCVCPRDIEAKITDKTKVILGVDIFGHPANWKEICRIAKKHNLKTIDDSCEALGAKIDGKMVGTFADVSTFAFYPNKQITTGEGGILVTDNEEVAMHVRALRNQGRSSMGGWLKHDFLGFNCRMSELSASLGVTQLNKIDKILDDRERVAHMYNDALKGHDNLTLQVIDEGVTMSWFVYVVKLGRGISRDAVIEELEKREIPARAYFDAIHEQPFMKNFKVDTSGLENTIDISTRTLALPFHGMMTKEEVDFVSKNLIEVIDLLKPQLAVA